jgi:hypothetical protein
VIYIPILGYMALMGLAAMLRWRYKIWLLLLVGTLAALASGWLYFRFARAQAPLYSQEVAAKLRAQPWPGDPAELARLIASFKAIGDFDDSNSLRRLYRLEVAHQLAGEPDEHFGTVAEAIAGKLPDTGPRAPSNTSFEVPKAELRALNAMLEVRAPRVSEWPPELARDAPLAGGAREMRRWPEERARSRRAYGSRRSRPIPRSANSNSL